MACRSSGPAGRDSKPVRPAARATARARAAARPPSQQARPLIGTAGKTVGRQQDVSNSAMVIATLSNRGLPRGVDIGCHDNAARRAWIGQTGAIRPLGEQRRRSGLWPTGCTAAVITSASPPRIPPDDRMAQLPAPDPARTRRVLQRGDPMARPTPCHGRRVSARVPACPSRTGLRTDLQPRIAPVGDAAYGADLQTLCQEFVQNAPGEGSRCAALLQGKGGAHAARSRFEDPPNVRRREANDEGTRKIDEAWHRATRRRGHPRPLPAKRRTVTSPVRSAGEARKISASRGPLRRRRGDGRPGRARR